VPFYVITVFYAITVKFLCGFSLSLARPPGERFFFSSPIDRARSLRPRGQHKIAAEFAWKTLTDTIITDKHNAVGFGNLAAPSGSRAEPGAGGGPALYGRDLRFVVSIRSLRWSEEPISLLVLPGCGLNEANGASLPRHQRGG
jgi:hypothetical protein